MTGPDPGDTPSIVGEYTNLDTEGADEPPNTVVTTIGTEPTGPGGVNAVMLESLITDTDADATPPKVTDVAPVKPEPDTLTNVPPATGPALGLDAVTTGAVTALNRSDAPVAEACPFAVTVTSTVPAASTGEIAVIVESLATVKLAAGTDPNLTAVAPVNPEPLTLTNVPPPTSPPGGNTDTTTGVTGGGVVATNVNRSAATTGLGPPAVVTTRTSTIPATCAGLTARSCVAETCVTDTAGTPPKVTDPPRKRVPVIVTAVPPETGPDIGDSDATIGPGTYLNRSATTTLDACPFTDTTTSTTPATND